MIYFVLPAQNIHDNQGRATGWKASPSSRASMSQLKSLATRLRELGPTRIIGSDLDHDSVWLLSRKLRIPYEEWSCLRRFNVGKLHGASLSTLTETLSTLEKTWQEKPDVPIKGGDSLTSYKKRMTASKARLDSTTTPIVIVAREREIAALTGLPATNLSRGRVYEWNAHQSS